MALYKDASGQLVIAATMPVGGAVVSSAATNNLSDLAPWYRNLDAANVDWHPAKFYSGAAESAALGTNGYSNAQVAAYKRAATLPTDNPGNVTYDFTNASITTSLGAGWYSDIPAGSGPVYVVFAPASSQDTTIAILAADWTNPPVLLFDSGTDGESSFPSFVFIRSTTQPATPTGGSYASPLPTTVGWSDGIPSDNNKPLWMSKRVFSKSGGAPQDAVWSATSKVGTPSTSSKLQFSVDGTTGWHDTPSAGDEFMRSGTSTDNGATWSYAGVVRVKGEAGSSGTATRGPSHWYTSGSFWSDSVANAVVTAAGYTLMAGDQVTISGTNFAHVKKWNGSSWIDLGQVITDDLVVTKSLTVSSVNTNGFDIRDDFGNIVFSAGHPVDYESLVGGSKPPSDATNGADSSNLRAGTSSNRVPNSAMVNTIDPNAFNHWGTGVSIGSAGLSINSWTDAAYQPTGTGSIYVHQLNNAGTGNSGICTDIYGFGGWWGVKANGVPVQGGQKVEITVYAAAHRCLVGIGIGFFNTAGDWVGGVGLDDQSVGTGGNYIGDYTRLGLFGTAPAGTAYYHIYYRKNNTLDGFANSYAWFSMPSSGICHSGQTEFSPYVPSYITSTKQLFDGADLGKTALWGALGGKPADPELLNAYKTWWNLEYKPGSLSELNAGDGSKLSGIQAGATNNSASIWANFVSKLSQSNLINFMDTAAITNAFIDSLDASKINTGYLHADRIDAGTVYMDTLNIASNAVTVPEIAKTNGWMALPGKNTNELLVSLIPSYVSVPITRIILITLKVRHTDSDPGYISLYLSKGGPIITSWYFDLSGRINGGANDSSYSVTFPVPYGAGDVSILEVHLSADDGSGTHLWPGGNWGLNLPVQVDLIMTVFTGKR